MALSDSETARLLVALFLLLGAAHAGGTLFARWRQPRVIGEILGGLLVGATVFGTLLPGLHEEVFPEEGAVPTTLGALYQLGLVLLMFNAGVELRAVLRGGERRVAVAITVVGTVLPFVAGLLVATTFDLGGLMGTADNTTSLVLVFAAAVAVTSIPVISRIMIDLGLMQTSFARIVLGAAVLEDVALYAVLAVAVGLSADAAGGYGLAAELRIDPASVEGALYYAAATGLVLGLALLIVRGKVVAPVKRVLARVRQTVAFQLLFLFVVTAVCLMLDVIPVFGGLVAGLVVGAAGERDPERRASTAAISRFSFAFFVPLYFALVGFQLDLARDLDLVVLGAFFVFACAVKAASVYLGARLAGERHSPARHFAVAMNARGGPGIVLASVSFEAGIVNEKFFTTLVLLAIGTSLLAGWWLERAVRRGDPLRPEEGGPPDGPPPLSDESEAAPRTASGLARTP